MKVKCSTDIHPGAQLAEETAALSSSDDVCQCRFIHWALGAQGPGRVRWARISWTEPHFWIWNRFLETGSAGRRPGQGRRLATTPNEDRYLVLTARRHRNMNATFLQQHLRLTTGTTVSIQTIRNRLQGVGLYPRRPMSRFSVHPDNRRIFICRDRCSRNNPAFVHESVRFGGGGVLVYGGISIDGRTDPYIIRDGPLTARQYRDRSSDLL
ncbi:transposable element Tcb2 transposase [Trichonephila clavipes]|nr:transposable element Tcb2 transposase [Trichonephila clavipes]